MARKEKAVVKGSERRVYILLDVPELGFVPMGDRQATSSSPQGALTNKIFKYKGEPQGRFLYHDLVNRYGLHGLVMEFPEWYGKPNFQATPEKKRPEQGSFTF